MPSLLIEEDSCVEIILVEIFGNLWEERNDRNFRGKEMTCSKVLDFIKDGGKFDFN